MCKFFISEPLDTQHSKNNLTEKFYKKKKDVPLSIVR